MFSVVDTNDSSCKETNTQTFQVENEGRIESLEWGTNSYYADSLTVTGPVSEYVGL